MNEQLEVPEGVTRVPECACPNCGHKMDAVTSAKDDGAKPSPGDLSICLECATPLLFNHDMTLRAMTKEDIEALHMQNQMELLAAIVQVKKFIASRKDKAAPQDQPETKTDAW